MARFSSLLRTVLLLSSFSVLLASCATEVNKSHPFITTEPDVAAANVYFLRPFTYRERGIADNAVVIELGGVNLLELGKGEYALLRLKPGAATLTTRNFTRFTNKDDPVEMTRSVPLELVPNKTYYLHIHQVNEEFRGVYYLPQLIDLRSAQQLLPDTRAIGAARSAPIESAK